MVRVKKCPKCGKEMEEGYISLMSGMRWRSNGDRGLVKGELLFRGSWWGFSTLKLALRCKDCGLVIFQY